MCGQGMFSGYAYHGRDFSSRVLVVIIEVKFKLHCRDRVVDLQVLRNLVAKY